MFPSPKPENPKRWTSCKTSEAFCNKLAREKLTRQKKNRLTPRKAVGGPFANQMIYIDSDGDGKTMVFTAKGQTGRYESKFGQFVWTEVPA